MSALVTSAIERGGLGELLAARRSGDFAALAQAAPLLEACDLLLLGALADLIRREEVGDEVKIYANAEVDHGDASIFGARERGIVLLRRVAIARITGPARARVRVDWGSAGLEIAQVALGFGASELEGPIANKRGLPIAEDATKKLKGQGMVSVQALAKKELAGLIRRAGREPVFASARANVEASEVRP